MKDETKKEILAAFKYVFSDSSASTRAFYSGMLVAWLTYQRNEKLTPEEIDDLMGIKAGGDL